MVKRKSPVNTCRLKDDSGARTTRKGFFKIMIKMIKDLVNKVDNIHEQKDNFSKEMKNISIRQMEC